MGDQALIVDFLATISTDENVVTGGCGGCKCLNAVGVRPVRVGDIADLVVQNLDSVTEVSDAIVVTAGRVIYLGVLKREIVTFELDTGSGRTDDAETLDYDVAGINPDFFNRGVTITRDDDRSALRSRYGDIQRSSSPGATAETDGVSGLCRVHLGNTGGIDGARRTRDRNNTRCAIGSTRGAAGRRRASHRR